MLRQYTARLARTGLTHTTRIPISTPAFIPTPQRSHRTMSTIPDRIAALQARIKELKIAKQDASAEVDEMKTLKAQLGEQKKTTETPGGSELQLKTPKGTIDHKPEATLLRKQIFNTLEGIFVKYGGSTIDTPVFELREILAGKYGEDSKLIYDLQDQGGELCSLRYDLTVSVVGGWQWQGGWRSG